MGNRQRRSTRFIVSSALLAALMGVAIAMPALADTLFPPSTGAFKATVTTNSTTYTYAPIGSPPTSTGPTISGVSDGQTMTVGLDGNSPPNATQSAFSRLRVKQCKGGTTVNNIADFDPFTTNKCTSVPLGAGTDFVDSGPLAPGTTTASVSFKAGVGTAPDVISGFDGSTLPGFTCDATHPCQLVLNVQVTSGAGSNNFLSFPIQFASAATAPGAPGTPTAVAGNAQATVSWTAPLSDGGSSINGYTVTSSPGAKTCTTTGATTCTVTGLTNGTPYTFTVTAKNPIGTGPPSAPSNSVTPTAPATAPGAPGTPTAVAGNAQATVSWTAPLSDGGSSINGYTVTSSPGAKTCTTTGATTCTVTGLTNGTPYTFTVTAKNTIGTGPPSAPSNSVTPATVPAAPTGAAAVAGDSQATVSWAAPASNGGSAINGYTVTSSPGNKTCTTTGATTCTVTGLTNGTPYTFTVTAKNTIGTGPPSAPSNTVTPSAATTVPSAPTGANAVAGDGQATVSWTAPLSDGGSPINGYTVTSSPGAKTCTTTGATTCTVTGLTNGTPYTFTVTAKNTIGTGPPSAPSNTVTPTAPATAPGAPGTPTAVAGNAQATVSWTAPLSDGGSSINGYTVTSSPGAKTCTTTGATTCTVTGLTNGTPYTFTVTAKNTIGTGPPSAPSNTVTPTAPANQPPVVDAGPAVVGVVNTPIALDGSASDPDGNPLTILWTVNSSACTVTPTNAAVSSIRCTAAGVYTATLTASDGFNPPVSDSTPVTISNTSDTTPPECSLISASSTGISVRTHDGGSGLAAISATIAKNAAVTIPPFATGTTSDVIVTATKIKLDERASVELTVTDVAGNTTVCDPILATVSAGHAKTFSGVGRAEHLLTVSEAENVTALVIEVNGVRQVSWRPNGHTFDLGRLTAGGNTVRVRVLGPAGSSATIMIWDGQ